MDHALAWGGHTLWLCPEKAAFWPDEGLLFVADFHLGKAHSFRRLGVPVPAGTSAANLLRLGALVDRLGAREVVFLGDFLHSVRVQGSPSLAAFADWRAGRPGLRLALLRGNHDRHAGDPPDALGIEVGPEPLRRGPWTLYHHPPARPASHALAGHLHPGVRLGGRGGDRLVLPAFHWQRRQLLVLPAFGEFTGHSTVRPGPEDVCFVSDGEHVIPLP
ncbi:ligase-associated DNA damage response endonuclease PdeM [Ideonella sp.]|uniref:ligase-associated DNA damage response endonuclease PdeM n=1 Tax=Ideonella sp. TaxID=1929293 RepID=UPI0035B2E3A2